MDSKRERLSTTRTRGDGMDNSLVNLSNLEPKLKEQNLVSLNMKPSKNVIASFQPVEPSSKVYNLVPKYVPRERKHPKYLTEKPREPKFIPYEPYKGAIDPIIPRKYIAEVFNDRQAGIHKSSKNNVEIQELVSQMSDICMSELNKSRELKDEEDKLIPRSQWDAEKLAYENDIKNLRESHSHLENQLKFQAQVNSELKTLLVAAVGEDLESRVQHLTEDKLQLARALLNSANHLTSHQEQTEWLSGQCEVWRSKFLASSLMVEELARWKSALTSRINDLQETIKGLLDEHSRSQNKSLKTYCHLSAVLNKLTQSKDYPKLAQLKHLNITEVTSANLILSKNIGEVVGTSQEEYDKVFQQISRLPQGTVTEKKAYKLLQNPVIIPNKQEAICRALMGTAMSLSGEQLYLQHPSSHATCCAHCTGEIKDI